jgi:FixJ family two-component response regulator
MQQDRQEIMRAGFNGFIEKPISLTGLLHTVRDAIELRRT